MFNYAFIKRNDEELALEYARIPHRFTMFYFVLQKSEQRTGWIKAFWFLVESML